MTQPAPTSSAFSTSPPATRTAASSSTSSGARPRPASCRSPSAAACAPSRISASSCSPAPTRCRSTPRPSTNPEFVREAAEKFGSQCIVVADRRQEGVGPGRARPLGDLHPWRAQADRHRRHRLRRQGRGAAAPASFSSPRWTATAPRAGYDLALIRAIADAVPVPVIASGGVGDLDDLVAGGARRPCQRRARRLDLPFRRAFDRAGEGAHGAGRPCDAHGRVIRTSWRA